MMKIISWNINGIRSIHEKGFLDWLKKENPDIVCLQEIKAKLEDIPEEIKKAGYYSYWLPAEKKGYAGVGVLSKIEAKGVNVFGVKKFDSEGRVLEIQFPAFTLMNLYFPHGGRDKSKIPFKIKMYDAFFNFLEGMDRLDKNLIVCGDFNVAHKEIDLSRPKDNFKNTMFTPEERNQIDKVIDSGFIDTFRHFNKEPGNYTWWSYAGEARERNLGWRIDYIFVPEEIIKKVKRAFILPDVKGSDHCPIGIEIF